MKKNPSNYDLQVDMGRRIFLDYDQALLIEKFSLDADDAWICLTYLNTPIRISRADGRVEELREGVWTECRNYSTVMTVYDLLCFHPGADAPKLAHQWCTVGTFVITGVTDTDAFTAEAAAFFDGHTEALQAACRTLGGTSEHPSAGADVVCSFPVTPFFPVLLRFWEGDEEFPPKLQLLWDRNADRFLHFETTFFLQGDLFRRLMQAMNRTSAG